MALPDLKHICFVSYINTKTTVWSIIFCVNNDKIIIFIYRIRNCTIVHFTFWLNFYQNKTSKIIICPLLGKMFRIRNSKIIVFPIGDIRFRIRCFFSNKWQLNYCISSFVFNFTKKNLQIYSYSLCNKRFWLRSNRIIIILIWDKFMRVKIVLNKKQKYISGKEAAK